MGRKKKRDIIIKHNDLIESKYHLTKIQQKIMLYIISNLNKSNNGYQVGNDIVINLDLQSIIDKVIPDTKHHSYILQNLEQLRKKQLIIRNNDNTKKQNDTHTGWIRDYDHFKHQSQIVVYIRDKLEPYLLHIKSFFTSYYLDNVILFQNSYSFRVYELCKQYLPIGYRKMEIQDLREYLDCENIYKQFNQLQKKILNITKEEINKYSDITIDYKVKRHNKKPVYIKYHIETKDKLKIPKNHKIYEMGLSQDKTEEIYNLYRNHQNELNETIDFLLHRKDRIKHFPPYAYVSLKNGIEGIIKYEKDKTKDVPKLYDNMKLKTKSGKVFTIKENVIRNEKGQIILVEGQIIQKIIQGKLDIIE